ncbi:hypothetical protein EJ110_NYTH49589 [Nymphaea thermarum]|nr:hypothetical protein EJ110_NYTH49589 [Nymphaea thermarum]
MTTSAETRETRISRLEESVGSLTTRVTSTSSDFQRIMERLDLLEGQMQELAARSDVLFDGVRNELGESRRKEMNAVVQEPDEESQALTIVAPARMNPLRRVSTLRQHHKNTTLSHGLLYVEVRLNEVPTYALVDTGATHNFVASRLVEHFGLVVKPNISHVKAINAVPSATDGEVEFVRTEVGS